MVRKLLNRTSSLFIRLLFRRRMNNLIYCPPSANPVGYNPVGHPDLLGKFSHAHLSSGVLHHSIRTFIALLLCLCSPSTVFLEVSKVIIFPVDGMLIRRGVPHVFNEVLEVSPSKAYRDVALGISHRFKSFVTRCPSPHVCPGRVRLGAAFFSSPAPSLAMNSFRLGQGYIGAISAASASHRTEGITKNIFNRATIAEACPSCVPTFSIEGRSAYHPPFPKSLPRDILDIRVVGFDFARLGHSSIWGQAHAFIMGLDSSERQPRSTAGVRAPSHNLMSASIA